MLKSIRFLAILSFIAILVVGCTHSSPVIKVTPIPTPTPIVFTAPNIPIPTPVQDPPSCFLGFLFCNNPTPAPCKPQYVYDDLIDMGKSWIVVNQQQDQNNSTSPTPATFMSITSKTIKVTDQQGMTETSGSSLGVNSEDIQSTITHSVQYQINISVSLSVTTTIGNSTTVTVPAGKTVYGNYGVKVQITDGRLYDQAGCEGENSYFGPDITYTPIAVGWCVWISGATPCPSVQP